jgi:hypothetical protein
VTHCDWEYWQDKELSSLLKRAQSTHVIVLFVLLYIYSWNGLLDGEEEISSCRESLGKQPGSIIDSNASPAQRQKV